MFGIIDFVKSAGRRIGDLFDGKDGDKKLEKEIDHWGLDRSGIDIKVEDDGKISISGEAASQEMKEKIILALGNVEGIESVVDKADVKFARAASRFHTVVRGDTLSAISKTYYGSYKHYPVIFEANKPMLTDPDKIYPGQVLRIPELSTAASA